MTTLKAIAEFWLVFQRCAGTLAHVSTANHPVYDELHERLQRIDPGLFLELSARPGNLELIITAEGDRSLFALVDAIVSAAHVANGWKVLALRPKLGFPESVEWAGYKINIADVVFDPLSDDESDELGLRLLVPGVSDAQTEKAHNALLRAIDHGLGEREFAEAVQYTEVAVLDKPADEYIPLVDLEGFIQWRKRRKH